MSQAQVPFRGFFDVVKLRAALVDLAHALPQFWIAVALLAFQNDIHISTSTGACAVDQ